MEKASGIPSVKYGRMSYSFASSSLAPQMPLYRFLYRFLLPTNVDVAVWWISSRIQYVQRCMVTDYIETTLFVRVTGMH